LDLKIFEKLFDEKCNRDSNALVAQASTTAGINVNERENSKNGNVKPPYKQRKKRYNGVDELMQDSFLSCFYNSESKEAKKKKAKKKVINNNIKQEDLNEINNSYNVLTIETEAESRKTEFFESNEKTEEISQKVQEKQFLSCSFSGYLSESGILEDLTLFGDEKDTDNCGENFFKPYSFNCKKESNYKKRISGRAAKLIKQHCSHKFMFRHFPREYCKETFNVRYQKQLNRRKIMKDKIFIFPKDIKHEKFDYFNVKIKLI